MSRGFRVFLIWTNLALASGATAQAPQKLVSPPEVDLPFGDANFPYGPGVEAINTNCVACHSVDHVMNQPRLSRDGWEERRQENGPRLQGADKPGGPGKNRQLPGFDKRARMTENGGRRAKPCAVIRVWKFAPRRSKPFVISPPALRWAPPVP